jgi:hypothetical protein
VTRRGSAVSHAHCSAVRDQLLGKYHGQWIGFADGAVIASGTSPVAVFHAAEATGRSPFVTCVGREDEPVRMRRVSFAYDGSYPGEPLPILTLEFRPVSGAPGVTLDRVIADMGADASALPWADCHGLQLTAAQGRPGWMGASQAVQHQPFTFVSGSIWMDKNTRADCKQTLLAMNASSGVTC